MIATNDVLTPRALREFLDPSGDDDDVLGAQTVIQCCAGEWRKEPNGDWRWWDEDDDVAPSVSPVSSGEAKE